MKAILRKTIGPNFRAGDIITGQNSRIKRLNDKGIVTLDHSLIAMIGNIISIIFSFLVLIFSVLTIFPFIQNLTMDQFNVPLSMGWIWRITLIIISAITISINISYFLNARIPYLTYFLSFSSNIFGGIAIMAGHEKTVSKYQPPATSLGAAISLFVLGSLSFAIAVYANILYMIMIINGDIDPNEFFSSAEEFKIALLWIAYILVISSGMIIGVYFDIDYKNRRKRYIGFLKNKNATIEYKTKAVQAMRAYKNTGNSDKFLERNIELIEESLEIDRNQIERPEKNKK